jgi:hypothetical protein
MLRPRRLRSFGTDLSGPKFPDEENNTGRGEGVNPSYSRLEVPAYQGAAQILLVAGSGVGGFRWPCCIAADLRNVNGGLVLRSGSRTENLTATLNNPNESIDMLLPYT